MDSSMLRLVWKLIPLSPPSPMNSHTSSGRGKTVSYSSSLSAGGSVGAGASVGAGTSVGAGASVAAAGGLVGAGADVAVGSGSLPPKPQARVTNARTIRTQIDVNLRFIRISFLGYISSEILPQVRNLREDG